MYTRVQHEIDRSLIAIGVCAKFNDADSRPPSPPLPSQRQPRFWLQGLRSSQNRRPRPTASPRPRAAVLLHGAVFLAVVSHAASGTAMSFRPGLQNLGYAENGF